MAYNGISYLSGALAGGLGEAALATAPLLAGHHVQGPSLVGPAQGNAPSFGPTAPRPTTPAPSPSASTAPSGTGSPTVLPSTTPPGARTLP